jgi:hypothetical protein
MILLYPPTRIAAILPGGYKKRLTAIKARHTCRVVEDIVRDNPFNPNEEPMGSTTFGNATPAIMIGPALPGISGSIAPALAA